MPHSTLTLSSPSPLTPYLPLLSDDTLHPAVRETLRKTFTRRLRLLHPDDRPESPLDTALADRVTALQSRVSHLSHQIAKARASSINSLKSTLPARIKHLNSIPATPLSPEPVNNPHPLDSVADAAAADESNVVNRVALVAKGVTSTKKRAASVREVLRILSDNQQLDRDTTRSIADDWTLNFADLPNNPNAVTEHEDDSPLVLKKTRGDDQVFLPISPHVTPRSKMRKKLLRSSQKSAIRQPSFSPLPR